MSINDYPAKLTDGYYRVRVSWEDASSQVGQYRLLSSATAKADANPGTHVFTDDGTPIYPEDVVAEAVTEEDAPQETPPNDGNTETIKYGKLNTLMNVRAGNSLDADKVTVLKKGAVIEILEDCGDGWYRIKCSAADCGYAYITNSTGEYITVGSSLYTVEAGDTLWKISEKTLGKGSRNGEIKTANKLGAEVIRVGEVLLIP
ncbi:MAG: LysM peptidoglycan-binding domain-containing protein [Lachnospiraceae bacterium]|nr:LysM peptidoglycan-binding domain-containing protein [Lachnospiraceae bacterium]